MCPGCRRLDAADEAEAEPSYFPKLGSLHSGGTHANARSQAERAGSLPSSCNQCEWWTLDPR